MVDSKCNCGVTPIELYLRQSGSCYLQIFNIDGKPVLFCTDGEEKHRSDWLANPTKECSMCMTNFVLSLYNSLKQRDDDIQK